MRESPTEVIDHEARSEAALAHQRISDHERACAERWAQTHAAIKALRDMIEARWLRLVGMVFVTLFSALGALAAMIYNLSQ